VKRNITQLFFYLCLLCMIPLASAEDEMATSLDLDDVCVQKILNMPEGIFQGSEGTGGSGQRNALLDALEKCSELRLADDLTIQMLGLLVGDGFYEVMEFGESTINLIRDINGLSRVSHGMESTDGVFSYFKPLHAVFEAVNWFFFGAFLLFLAGNLFSQALNWGKGNLKVDAKKWFNRHGVSAGAVSWMMYPMVGWMTPLQFVAIGIIVVFVVLSKVLVSALFLASFMGDVAIEVAPDIRASIMDSAVQTSVIYICDLKEREELINGILSGIDSPIRADLERDPLFSCLTSAAADPVLGKARDAGRGLVSIPVTLPSVNQTYQCYNLYEEHARSLDLSPPSTCGSVSLTIPGEPSNTNATELGLAQIFIDDTTQNILREAAIISNEFDCRKQLTANSSAADHNDADCLNTSINSAGYRYSWVKNDDVGIEQLGHYDRLLTDAGKEIMRERLQQKKVAAQDAVLTLLNDPVQQKNMKEWMASALAGALIDPALAGAEEDIKELVLRMKRGGMLSGGVFFSYLSGDIKDNELMTLIKGIYRATSEYGMLVDIASSVDEATNASGRRAIFEEAIPEEYHAIKSVLPRPSIYLGQMDCWFDQSACTTVSINPFTQLSKEGVRMLREGLVGVSVTFGLTQISKQDPTNFKKYGRPMLYDVIGLFYVVYAMLGLFFAVLIPLVPLFHVMALIIGWAQEVIKTLIGFQLTLCMSPMGGQTRQLFTDEVRAMAKHVVGLGLYFMFIMLGVIVAFLMFCFYFAMNVLLVGAMSYAVTWSGATNSIESFAMAAVYDTVLCIILFIEIKASSKYIHQIPAELMSYFEVDVESYEATGDRVLQELRSKVLPQVSSFMSNPTSMIK
jgi:hypothetical protein